MRAKVGDRVGALACGNEKRVVLYGYGVLRGDEVPEVPADSRTAAPVLMEAGIPNPAIDLDSGEVVYGCECWWGPEDEIRECIEAWRKMGAEIVQINPSDDRARGEGREAEGGVLGENYEAARLDKEESE